MSLGVHDPVYLLCQCISITEKYEKNIDINIVLILGRKYHKSVKKI